MAKETITQSPRFYCVSLSPDICKTPIGNSTPPIPYNIIGEFKESVSVSKNVKTHSEPVILHGRSHIPKVSGDEPGKAGGIKSGVNKDKAETKEKSGTLHSNVMDVIREGDKVWMNAKNTVGRAMERGGQAARQYALPYAQKYLDDVSPALHEASDKALEVGGNVAMAGGVTAGAGAAVTATGIGAPVGGAMVVAGGATATVGGAVAGVGAAGSAAATAGDTVANAIVSGKMPDVLGAAGNMASNAFENVVLRKIEKIPGVKSITDRFRKKDAPPPPAKKGDNNHDGNDGGKAKKPKDDKDDKPSDCCPKNSAPGGKSAKSPKPIHFATGEETLSEVDFVIEGPHPFAWTRTYRSGSESQDWGLLGARWSTPYTSRLSVCEQGIVYHEDSGRALRLPSLAVGQSHDHASEGFLLERDSAEQFTLTWRDGSTDTFIQGPRGWLPHGYRGCNAMLRPGEPVITQDFYLSSCSARDGKTIRIERHHAPQANQPLMRIHTIDGVVLEAFAHESSLEQQQKLSTPAQPGSPLGFPPRISHIEELRPDGSRIRHVSYSYAAEAEHEEDQDAAHDNSHDPDDDSPIALAQAIAREKFSILPRRYNLVAHRNILGQERSYDYHHHLLVRYTNYNAFSFQIGWVSLERLRQRWANSPLTDDELATLCPITLANSYQARAVIQLTEDGCNQWAINYIADGVSIVTEPDGGQLEYHYNSQWLFTDVRRLQADGKPAASLGKRRWSTDGKLLADIDAQGNTSRYTYDAAGNLTSITNALGHSTHISYNDQNLPIAVTDALGHTSLRAFDEAGRIIASKDPLDRVSRYTYDDAGRLSQITDARGGNKTLSYDQAGRLKAYTDCSELTTHYEYDNSARLIQTTDAQGRSSYYNYDGAGRLTQLTHPDHTQETYTYDAQGNLLTHTDAQSQTIQYRYNGHDLPKERIDAKGQSIHYHYDKALRLNRLANAKGESYLLAYDSEGRLVKETGFDGKTTLYSYDSAGQLTASQAGGQTTTYLRDSLGQLLAKSAGGSSEIPLDGATRYAYDPLGRLSAISSPHAQQHYIYDSAGQLIEERIAYALRLHQDLEIGFVPGAQPPSASFKLTHCYDELGNRASTTLPNGRRIDILRYGSGHWHGLQWQGESLIDVERDQLHREIKREMNDGTKSNSSNASSNKAVLTTTRSYDPQSRLQSIATTYGATLLRQRDHLFDASGQLLHIEEQYRSPISAQSSHLAQINPSRALAAAQLQRHSIRYTYDPLGQLLQSNQPDLSEIFAFDPAGNLLDLASQEEAPTQARDTARAQSTSDSRAQSALNSPVQPALSLTEQPAPTTAANLLRAYQGNEYVYDVQGNTVAKHYASTTQPAHSLFTQVAQAASSASGSGGSSPTSIAASVAPEAATLTVAANQAAQLHLVYDEDQRLIRAQRTWRTTGSHLRPAQISHYRYDAFGRRIAKLICETRPAAAGASLERAQQLTLFIWDGDRLAQEINADTTVSYVYEPESFVPLARIESAKQTSEGLSHYERTSLALHTPTHWDSRWQELRTIDLPPAIQTAWSLPQSSQEHAAHLGAYRAHLHAQREQAHARAWRRRCQRADHAAKTDRILHYHCDHLGTPLQLTDSQGKTHWSARYKAWGRVLRYEVKDIEQPLRFQGQYEDAETGLYYNRHRYYDPDQARYITPDPIGLLGGLNLYQYAPNPLGWVDPMGLKKHCGTTYRALTKAQEDQAAKGEALMPKTANNPHSIQEHVEDGSRRTQFISTSRLLARAQFYAKRHNATIVEIDLCKIPDHQIEDISDGSGLTNNPAKKQFARSWAMKDQEVLIRGRIPAGSYRVI